MWSGKFHKWLNDDTLEDRNFTIIDENAVVVTHKVRKELKQHDGKGSIIHGAFTTAWARLHLYEQGLQKKNEKGLYFDTDSIIYLLKPGDEPLPLGNELGQFTDEIEPVVHPDFPDESPRERYISSFVSGGPKNYCLEVSFKNRDGSIPARESRRVSDFKTVIRGFSLGKETRKNQFRYT